MYPPEVRPDAHPEQGPVWKWEVDHIEEVMERLGANYAKTGPGILRKIPDEDLLELKNIFDITGGTKRFAKIEDCSRQKAEEMGMKLDESLDSEYINHIYTTNDPKHTATE
jgi:heterodisulfide reductase subunit C